MCKTIPQAMSQRDREIRRMRQAAEQPGVAEFGSMIADVRRLAFRIGRWLEANPANRRTETITALKIAMQEKDYDDVAEAHRILSSLGWMLETAASVITSTMLVQVFPSCFEPLDDELPTGRSTVR